MNYEKNIITIFDMFGFRRDLFDRLSNEEMYLETMNNAQHSTKLTVLDYIRGDSIVDVGSGGGVLLDAIEKQFPDKNIAGTDISQNVIEELQKKINNEGHAYQVWRHNFVYNTLWSPVDNIIFSSILHEVFSYTEFDGRKFNLDSIRSALQNAIHSLNIGGRLIIRDGVKTNSCETVSVRIKDEDLLVLAKNYLKDFHGLPELQDRDGHYYVKIDGNMITGNINLIREMLYTITWGAMSYPQEVQEQFGYFTLDEFVETLESMGMTIVEAKEFTESGYPEHLSEHVELIDFTWDDIPSNCIIVATKK
jgi:SAM-dependent methyltransferase